MARKSKKSAPKFHLPAKKCKRVVMPKSAFDPRSFRWTPLQNGGLLIGCPKGEWNAGTKRCKVGTRAHEIVLAAAEGGRCKTSYKRAK